MRCNICGVAELISADYMTVSATASEHKKRLTTKTTPDFFIPVSYFLNKVDSKVKSDLKRILATETVEGEGVFKNANQSVAVNAAMNLAINDLAKRAGQLIQEEDTTLYNEKVYSIIRTRARNIVSGFDVVVKEWDGDSQTATVRIRQDGYRIAEELCKYVTD